MMVLTFENIWQVQEQVRALWSADQSFFRFIKAFTNRPGQLSALRARARHSLRSVQILKSQPVTQFFCAN
jgi:hypothetical protein